MLYSILTDSIIFVYGALAALTLYFSYIFFYTSRDKVLRETTQLRRLVGIVFGWLAFGYVYGFFYTYEPFSSSTRVTILVTNLDLFVFPLVNFVLVNVTHLKPITKRFVLLHVSPFWVATVVGLIIGQLWFIALEIAMVVCYILITSFILFRAGIVYNQYIQHQYSSLQGRDVGRVLVLLVVYIVLACGWVLSEYFGSDIALLLCNLLELICLPMLKHRMDDIIMVRELSRVDSETMDEKYVSEFKKHKITLAENSKSGLNYADEEKVEAFKQKLIDVCEKTKLYVTEDLTRDDLCREMGTNHTYFTRLLKLATGKNFNEYINGLRIDYAEQLLLDVLLPLNDIPDMVGFSSKSSYYSAFKARHHCTPQQYRNQILVVSGQ